MAHERTLQDPWLPEVERQYVGQDFSDYAAHRRKDGSDRDSVLSLAGQLGVDIRETLLEAEGSATRALLIGDPAPDPSAAIVYFHGGGHMFGDAYSQAHELVTWSAELGVQVLSVDYRLSPEHPFPAAFNDGRTALSWLRKYARHLNIAVEHIFIYGVSAGGGLAAALAIEAIEQDIPLAGLILASPMLDHRTSCKQHRDEEGSASYTWNHENNRQGWSAYLGGAGVVHPPKQASPGSAETLPLLPPSYIDVGGSDLFLNENLAFAQKAMESGSEVDLRVWGRGYHGFEVLAPESGAARTSRAARRGWLKLALSRRCMSLPQ